MMTLPTGNPTSASVDLQPGARTRPAAFTLIELILVMSMLLIVLSVAAPSLKRFFRGRALDSEVNRFLALTRYGQSRAVSEGLPVILWIDPEESAYGLQADSSYTEEDTKAREYQIDKDVKVQVEQSTPALKLGTLWKGNNQGLAPKLPKIRFTPDGFLSESSPDLIVFRQENDSEIWIGPSRNRLNYEVYTNQLEQMRR